MKLMLATDWARKYFVEGNVPDVRTAAGWVKNGVVAGRIMGRFAYVDEEAWLADGWRPGVPPEKPPEQRFAYRI